MVALAVDVGDDDGDGLARGQARAGQGRPLAVGERGELREGEAAVEGVEAGLEVRGEAYPDALRVRVDDVPVSADR